MTEQYCPICEEKRFNWSIDEEVSSNTLWQCLNCGYKAEENESLESKCDKCATPNLMHMKSDERYFWFCTNCQYKTKAPPW